MMKGDTPLASKTIAPSAKSAPVVVPSDRVQSQHLFAAALKRADTRPQPIRKKTSEDQLVSASITMPIAYATALSPAPATISATPDPAMAAHIERIAAAIAEVTNKGASAEIHLQLPPGATRIDGAVIGRNDAGQMHIVLTTAAAISPAASAQLQSQLTERLLRRDIRVSRMTLQRTKGLA